MSSLKPVADNHRFDEKALADYLRTNLRGFEEAEAHGALKVLQFTHGQSNPTFYLEVGSGKNTKKYVLRKKPNGKLLPSAHAIEREYRVMKALEATSIPVPRCHLLCTNEKIVGTPFYIMDFIEGRIFKDTQLAGVSRSDRFAIYAAMNRTLALLHQVDVKKVGLGDYGRTDNFIKRQVERWTAQYDAAKTSEISAMEKVKKYLKDNLPVDEDSKPVTLIHGDYRLDNIIFHPTEPRILAVLDWELSTLGNPSLDIVYNCMNYYFSTDQAMFPGLKGSKFRELGIPTLRDYIHAYIRDSRRCGGIAHWDYFLTLSFFRLASIAQGIYKRFLQGNASNSMAEIFKDVTVTMSEMALQASQGTIEPKPKKNHMDPYEIAKASAQLLPARYSQKFWELRAKLLDFMEEHVIPNEQTYIQQHRQLSKEAGHEWVIPPILDVLKEKAKSAGLWNLFLTVNKTHPHEYGAGLTNLEYAPLCEIMGYSVGFAPEVFNCSAPDTGNMETIAMYGTEEQKKKWLEPLLRGEIRSCFGMTEPRVASSDASNIETRIERQGDNYVINGHKWWTSGAMDPRCKLCILMGKTDEKAPKYRQQSMILVPLDLPGITIVRPLAVFGQLDSPHGHAEIHFRNVVVPKSNILLGEGRGFEIAQGRLGPGRIHHCMRLLGMAERALEYMVRRVQTRHAFGGSLAKKGAMLAEISKSRIEIDQCRLLTLQAASMIDEVGAKFARQQIAMIKIANPNTALNVIDRAIQAYGAEGVCSDTVLPFLWIQARTLRLADGPDEVHRETVAQIELIRARL